MSPPAHPEALRRLHAEAQSAIHRRAWIEAEALCEQMIGLDPAHADAFFLAGIAALEQRRVAVAIKRLQHATELQSTRADYAAQLARALSMVNRLPEALVAADRARSLQLDEALTLDTLGVVYSRANAHERAVEVFLAAVARSPNAASYRFNLAASMKFLGRFDEAESAYEACIELEPRYWKAHSALAQLRRQTSERNHIARLQSLLPLAGDNADAHLHLHQALAKEHEDLGDDEIAFEHLVAGKSRKRAQLPYAIADDAAIFDTLQALFANTHERCDDGDPSREPIFVVGMPRSGTTLVERILSSHPQVQSAGELQQFGLAVKRLAGTRSPRVLDVETLRAAIVSDRRVLGQQYIASTRPATGQRPHFVDKMPLNFLYAGFIAQALPNARIVCLRRHPLDTCLSNFRQLFALDFSYYHYAYDLLDCGRYYMLFDRLMAHWQRVLPGRILEVQYEKLVAQQEPETRRLLDFCGLGWDEACLRFEDNIAPVSTASAVQVREPLYRTSVARWKRYETELKPLRELLESAGIDTVGRDYT